MKILMMLTDNAIVPAPISTLALYIYLMLGVVILVAGTLISRKLGDERAAVWLIPLTIVSASAWLAVLFDDDTTIFWLRQFVLGIFFLSIPVGTGAGIMMLGELRSELQRKRRKSNVLQVINKEGDEDA